MTLSIYSLTIQAAKFPYSDVSSYYQQDHGCNMSMKIPYCNFEVCMYNDSITDVLRVVSVLWL